MAAIHVVGGGVVARRVMRLLRHRSVIGHDPRSPDRDAITPGDAVILAHGGEQADRAGSLIERGAQVITITDSCDDAADLLALHAVASERELTLVVGAGMSPGLSGLIARHTAAEFEVVDEIHVAVHGTAGPDCARVHHQSLRGAARAWHNGAWRSYPAGRGRELVWFPEPVGAADCYRAQSADPLLLQHVFPSAERVSYRRSARRRDRLTSRLPMLSPPPSEGAVGGLRVELRGAAPDGARLTVVNGVAELIGTATAGTAAALACSVDRLPNGVVVPGDAALPTVEVIRLVTDFGVRLQSFTGVPQR